ncbi:uncharacterized protein DS421_20g701440 [Arachis hypogaea]|nr:uncharacterized protein DS421_20g701440 [Arachis hypogaea]
MMEKTSVPPSGKGKEVMNSSEDTPASQSKLDREGHMDINEHGTTQDQKVLHLLWSIREHLDRDEETTKTMLQSHGDQIKKLAEVVEGHNHILGALVKNMSTKEDSVPANTNDGKTVSEKERRQVRKTSNASKKTETGSISRTTPELKSKKPKMADSYLKRMLYFEEESATDEMTEVHQDGQGSPFTYYTHFNAYMDGAKTTAGMEFIGMELAVAAYIFAKDLPKSEVFVSTEHCLGDRRALHTLCPGERVMDDVISLVAVMYTGGAMSESVLKRWWLPTFFQDRWYLMIIDFFNWKLVYLDSLKDSRLTKALRKDQMLYVAFFLENLLADNVFYDGSPDEMHKPSTYEIVEPEIGQQADGS